MATKSGMNYGKVAALIEFMSTQKTDIINNLTELQTVAPANIATHYSGSAADTYQKTLGTVIKNITDTLNLMINTLKDNTIAKQEEYEAQDKKMQDSVNIPTS